MDYYLSPLTKNDIYGLLVVSFLACIFNLISLKTFLVDLDINTIVDYLPKIAPIFLAIFAWLTWKLNEWQQEKFKNPIPEIYFSEPQILATSENDKKALITFLIYFLNTGTSPIVGSGIEHRVGNLDTGQKYKFRETRFFHSTDDSFGMIVKGLEAKLSFINNFLETPHLRDGFETIFNIHCPEVLENNIKIRNLYPSQKIEELWELNWKVPSKDYISERETDSYWIINPNKIRIKRYYIKVPCDNSRHSFQIKLILHYYCGSEIRERLKFKEFKIKPIIIGDSLCLYDSEIKERTVFDD